MIMSLHCLVSLTDLTWCNLTLDLTSTSCLLMLLSNDPCYPIVLFTLAGTPMAPADFNYTMIDSTTVTVSWQPSYTMNISNIKYNLSWYTMGALVNSTELSSAKDSYTIENLVPDTEYVLTINTRNTDNDKESHATSITVRTPIAGN